MKKLSLFLSLALAAFTADAQFVTIPDANFRAWLVQNHPSCMNANQEMDVNCVDGITSVDVSFKNISDMDGIQYFDGLLFPFGCIFPNLKGRNKGENMVNSFVDCIHGEDRILTKVLNIL